MYAADVYSGTAGLTAALRRVGLTNSLGVDAHVTKQVRAPVVRLDLTTPTGVELLWKILQHKHVAVVHLGPPFGTSSRARHIRRAHGPDPKPLRSAPFLDVTYPSGVNAKRVAATKKLYSLAGEIFARCTTNGILCTLENPARSYMWATSSHTTPATLVNSHEGLWSPNDLSSVIAQVCHRLLLSVDVIDIL